MKIGIGYRSLENVRPREDNIKTNTQWSSLLDFIYIYIYKGKVSRYRPGCGPEGG